MRKLTHEELVTRQFVQDRKTIPCSVLVNDVRSLYNVGSIFRTADGAGIEKVWLCGITGVPPAGKISKTALGAETRVVWEYRPNALKLLADLKEGGTEIILLEQTAGSGLYQDFKPSGPMCLVLGNEITGVDDRLLALTDRAVEIEMAGHKNSLNVTVAFGIVAYHIRNRMLTAAKPAGRSL